MKLSLVPGEKMRRVVSFKDMKDNEIGKIVSSAGYTGEIVMKKFDMVFSLGADNHYWSGVNSGYSAVSHVVELLEPGTQVILTVE